MFLTHSHYVEIENGALLRDVVRSLKMILGGHGKVRTFLGKKCGTINTFATKSTNQRPTIATRRWIKGHRQTVSRGTANVGIG